MKKLILFTLTLFTISSFAQDRPIVMDITRVCGNEKNLDLQVQCTQDMIKCLRIDNRVGNLIGGEFTRCVMKLDPKKYSVNK